MFKSSGTKFGTFSNDTPSYSMKTTYSSSVTNPSKENSNKAPPTKIEQHDFVPKRFGLKYDPPTIIMEYLVPSSGKLYHHKMKLRDLQADTDTFDAIESVKKKHFQYFMGNKISETQMTNLVDKLKKSLAANPAASSSGTRTFGDNKNVKAGSFAPINSNLSYKPNGLNSGKGQDTTSAKKEWDFEDYQDDDDDEDIDYNTTNLNKLSKEEVQKHKDKMDVLFNKNYKKPGDAGFIYDKQVEFKPELENEWDEDDDDF